MKYVHTRSRTTVEVVFLLKMLFAGLSSAPLFKISLSELLRGSEIIISNLSSQNHCISEQVFLY